MNLFLPIISPEMANGLKTDLNNTALSGLMSEVLLPVDFAGVLGSIAVSEEIGTTLVPEDIKTILTNIDLPLTTSNGAENLQNVLPALPKTINQETPNQKTINQETINQNIGRQVIQPIETDINLLSGMVSDKVGDPSTRLIGAMPESEHLMTTAQPSKPAESILFRSNVQPQNISTVATTEAIPAQIVENANIKEVEIVEAVDKATLLPSNKTINGNSTRTIAPTSEAVVQPVMSNARQDMGGSGNQSLFDKNLFESRFDLTGSNKISNGDVSVSNFADYIKTDGVAGKNEMQQIRFILPQDFGPESIKEHKTITIKMEPQSLGTIRLTLTSHVNNLIGRMIVDNPTTLTAIESNIEHLYQELSDKGIKLDSMQLSLGGNQTESGLKSDFDQFFGSDRSSGRQYSYYENSADIPDSFGESPVSGTYISASGVNWLA
jgi:flagellar hook-length control protein FliK